MTSIDTTQIYTMIRPPKLKQAVSFYEERAVAVKRRRISASGTILSGDRMIVGALLAGAMRSLPAPGYYRDFMGTQIGSPDERGWQICR